MSGHRWVANEWTPADDDLHARFGTYLPSVFDVAHDRGVFTGLFVTKSKLALFDASYDAESGCVDAFGNDDGTSKNDSFHFTNGDEDPVVAAVATTDAVLAALRDTPARSLIFIHYRTPDTVGHDDGWDLTRGSPYLTAVASVDREIGRLIAHVESDDHFNGRTAIVVTTDHGGGAPFKSHTRSDMWVNYIIPLIVWTGDGTGADLYELNASTRSDPGTTPAWRRGVSPHRFATARPATWRCSCSAFRPSPARP